MIYATTNKIKRIAGAVPGRQYADPSICQPSVGNLVIPNELGSNQVQRGGEAVGPRGAPISAQASSETDLGVRTAYREHIDRFGGCPFYQLESTLHLL